MTAVASGTINDKKYDRLEVVKKNTSGDKLSGAGFRLKRLAEAGMTEKDMGLKTTATESSIRFEELTAGNYTLTEEVVPTGYVNNNLAISLKVTKLESGFKVELVGDYTGIAKIEQNVLTIVNKKPGDKPNKDNGIKVIDDRTPRGDNKQRLPRTGGTNTGLYYGAGAGLLLLAGFAVIRSKKKEQ